MMSWQDYISQFLSFHIVIVYQVLCWPWWVDVCIQQNWFELVTAADNAVQFSWINSSKPSFALHLENHSSASSALHVSLCPLWLSDHIQIFREYLPFVLHDLFTLLHCQKITASHGFVKCLSKLPKQSEIRCTEYSTHRKLLIWCHLCLVSHSDMPDIQKENRLYLLKAYSVFFVTCLYLSCKLG